MDWLYLVIGLLLAAAFGAFGTYLLLTDGKTAEQKALEVLNKEVDKAEEKLNQWRSKL